MKPMWLWAEFSDPLLRVGRRLRGDQQPAPAVAPPARFRQRHVHPPRPCSFAAAAFGFAHIIYGSVVAGWIFARDLPEEHSLYGVLAFTTGLGDIFYHGTLDT